MYVILYITIGIYVLYTLLKRRSTTFRKTIPGPHGWPLVGIGFEITVDNIHIKFSEYAQRFGDIFNVNVFGSKIVVLNTPDLVKRAFNTEPYRKHMNDRSKSFLGEKVFFGSQGIGFSEHAIGSVHSVLRKGFTKAINVYGEGKREFESKVQNELKDLMGRVDHFKGKEFDLMALLKQSMAKIVTAVLGDSDVDNDDVINLLWSFNEQTDFFMNLQVDGVLVAFPFLSSIPSTYKKKYDALMSSRQLILQKYFHNIKATHKPGEIRGLIDYFFDEQANELALGDDVLHTDDIIKTTVLEMVFAGMSTTLAAVSSIFLCLIHHPEYQRKIQDEIDVVIGRDRVPGCTDKRYCPIIEAFTLETLRHIPVVPLAFPHLCRPNIDFEGHEIKAGSLIIPNIWFIHHDEKIWGDPWTFRPERFLDSDGHLLPGDHPYMNSWLSFGSGRRQCVGESFARSRIFLFVATLLQRFTFSMDPNKLVSSDPRKGSFSFGLECIPNHYYCKAVPRN